MNPSNNNINAEKAMLSEAESQGGGARWKTYTKLSGPGWLQGAITLGGGSLGGSLYLGVIGGYQFMWLQPLMMVFGVLMLSVIGYVSLSTGEKPLGAINRHINPVLGWGWLLAVLAANLVWAMPQFSLGTAALQQNLFPGLLGGDGEKYVCVLFLFLASAVVVWSYDRGSKGMKLFEIILKVMVGIIVVSFFGVVIVMTFGPEGLPWGTILAGFVPDFSLFWEPADKFQEFLAQSENGEHWRDQILGSQRDIMVTAAATAVGINMTFLLPYSMLRKGWGREHRGLATFDLSTGLFVPFVLATSCVVIASSSQFHGQSDTGLLDPAKATAATEKLTGAFNGNLDGLLKAELGGKAFDELDDAAKSAKREGVSEVDKKIAAMLVKRDAFQLADSLENLTGSSMVSQTVFGIGVVGMAISTIIILMLINGFIVTEMLGNEIGGAWHRFGAMLPGITGSLGYLWFWRGDKPDFWLAVPTSVFGMVLLPIAYITFFLMINNKSLMGEALPQGGKRVALNIAMLVALLGATIGAGWSIWSKVQWTGVGIVAVFVVAVLSVHFSRAQKS